MTGPPGGAVEQPVVAPWRLIATLGGAGAIAGIIIVVAFGATRPAIEAHRARRLDAAIQEVLKDPVRYDTVYLVNDALTTALPAGEDGRSVEKLYRGYAADGKPIGYAIVAAAPGFQDVVELIFGYDPQSGAILGMKVLESKETPGLGDKIEKDTAFVAQFDGAGLPLIGTKNRDGGRPEEIDMITGATISSRTVIRIINDAAARLAPLIERAEEETP